MTTVAERPPRDLIAHTNSHGPLARLAKTTEAGTQLWDTWHGHFRDEQLRLSKAGLLTFSTTDDNQHGAFGLGKGWRHIGGQGIDSIGMTRPVNAPRVKLGAEKRCNLKVGS